MPEDQKATSPMPLASYRMSLGSEARMKASYLFHLSLAVVLLGPSVARAQRGAHFVAARPSVSVRHGAATIGGGPIRTGRRNTLNSTNGFSSNGFFGNGLGLSSTNIYPGSGIGINGINQVLTQSNLGVEAAIDPATQWNLALTERLLRLGGGVFPGYYLLGGGGYVVPAESAEGDQPVSQQQPQVVVLQQAPAQTQMQAAQVVPEQAAPPLPDVGQFTLVLQDGRQIQAVAFTQMKDRIIYVTSDGSRRTVALADLNKDETIRVNQERGTPLQLPL